MGWKTIYIKTNNYLSVKDNWLFVHSKEEKEKVIKYFLSDLKMVVLDNYRIVISLNCLNGLINNGVSIVYCDEKHDPNAITLPLNIHYMPLQNLQKQINMSLRFKNRVWQKLIVQKIRNQRNVLEFLGAESEIVEKFKLIEKKVLQGDTENREAEAAKIFFREIYGSSFLRHADDGINAALNFGYKIIASYITRTIIMYGLLPPVGVWHSNQGNYFNLTYDLIEPFRPIVDYYVTLQDIEYDNSLDYKTRIAMLKILDLEMVIDNKSNRIYNAIDIYIKSFVSSLEAEKDENLKLPFIIPLDNIEDDLQ